MVLRGVVGALANPKRVQELLHHSSIALTMDRYTHRILPMGEQTAAAIERVLGLFKLLSKPDPSDDPVVFMLQIAYFYGGRKRRPHYKR